MKKTKLQEGITLIALIITIIILLILAVVTIGSIKKNNIITYAQNAAKDYNAEKDKEESTILGYEELIESNLPGVQARVPFKNYIEDGPYYYVCKIDSDTDGVITISRDTSTFNIYSIKENKIEEDNSIEFEVIDKVDLTTRLGYGPEMIEQAIGVPYDELNDDILIYNESLLNIFKSNYTEMIYGTKWFTLDTNYEFPTE